MGRKDWLAMRSSSWNGWRRSLVFFLPFLFILLNLFYVLELHQNPAAQPPPKKMNTKFDHLVLGPAAGQGLPNRLQCQGTKALKKTHTPSSSNAGESVSFVTVFTVCNTSLADSRLSNLVTVGNASYAKMERSMAVLNVFVNFTQTFLETRLEKLAQNPGPISHYILTDSDIAVVDDLGHLFNDHPNFHPALYLPGQQGATFKFRIYSSAGDRRCNFKLFSGQCSWNTSLGLQQLHGYLG